MRVVEVFALETFFPAGFEYGARHGYRKTSNVGRTLRIEHFAEALFDTIQRQDGVRRLTAVIAFERFEGRGVGSYDCDGLCFGIEREHVVSILKQYDGFFGHLARQQTVRLGIDLAERNARVGHVLRRIEHTQAKAGGEKTGDGSIDFFLVYQLVFQGLAEAGELRPAGGVGSGAECQHGSVFFVRRVLMSLPYIGHCPAIGGDEAVELPILAQCGLQQPIVGAGGGSIDGVVSTHDGISFAFDDRGVEGGEIGRL